MDVRDDIANWPVVASYVIVVYYSSNEKAWTKRLEERAKMAQCQSWHLLQWAPRIFDCSIDRSSLGWHGKKQLDRITVHFGIYYLGLWVRLDSWTISCKTFRNAYMGLKLFTKVDRTNHRGGIVLLSGLLSEGNANVLNLFWI